MRLFFFTLLSPFWLANGENTSLKVEDFKINYLEQFVWSGPGQVHIVQSDVNELTLNGPEEALRHTKIEARGGTLRVNEVQHSVRHPERSELVCTLKVRHLSKLDIRGAAQVTASDLQVEDLTVHLVGNPNLTMGLKGRKLIFVSKGASQATLTGHVNIVDVQAHGPGNYDAQGLSTERSYLRLFGTGEFKVQASGELSVYNQGDARVIYSGNPEIVNKKNLGNGSISP